MTISYFVLYRGVSADQERFTTHYRNIHVPILLEFPGILGVCLHTPVTFSDTKSVVRGGFALIAQMEFADETALFDALASEARTRARRDMEANFPSFEGVVWHQATNTERHLNDHAR